MAKHVAITLSDDLFEVMEILRKRRKYRTPSEYIQGLIRYDGQSQKEHHLTAEWAAITGYERDRLDAGILNLVKTGKGRLGSWLEARIEAIVKEQLAAGKTPTKKAVAQALAEEIAKDAD